jgi:hypothetical protein
MKDESSGAFFILHPILHPFDCAAVSPTSTEFTRGVSRLGAQATLKSDASADFATPAALVI